MAEPDFTFLDGRIRAELDRRTVENHGGGGHDGGMDGRVAKLEADVKDIRTDLKTLVKDVAELKGRAAAMPTMWQLITMFMAVVGVVATFSIFTVNRVDRVETKIDAVLNRLPPMNH